MKNKLVVDECCAGGVKDTQKQNEKTLMVDDDKNLKDLMIYEDKNNNGGHGLALNYPRGGHGLALNYQYYNEPTEKKLEG